MFNVKVLLNYTRSYVSSFIRLGPNSSWRPFRKKWIFVTSRLQRKVSILVLIQLCLKQYSKFPRVEEVVHFSWTLFSDIIQRTFPSKLPFPQVLEDIFSSTWGKGSFNGKVLCGRRSSFLMPYVCLSVVLFYGRNFICPDKSFGKKQVVRTYIWFTSKTSQERNLMLPFCPFSIWPAALQFITFKLCKTHFRAGPQNAFKSDGLSECWIAFRLLSFLAKNKLRMGRNCLAYVK